MKQGLKDLRDGIAGAIGGIITGLVLAFLIAIVLKPILPEPRHFQTYGQVRR